MLKASRSNAANPAPVEPPGPPPSPGIILTGALIYFNGQPPWSAMRASICAMSERVSASALTVRW